VTLREGPRFVDSTPIDDDDPALDKTTLDVASEPERSSVQVEELRISDLIPLTDSARPTDDTARADQPHAPKRTPNREFIDLPTGTVVGEFEIERKIGEGGMGAVYAALHPILGKRAAIKVIAEQMSRDADAIARFRREARAIAQLASPHIVDVFGFGELADGRAYFVMEYLTGESLRSRLDRGRVPLDEALELLDQIARGLEAAHESGIVHRDLKPENIFIERNRSVQPVVKLLDFGLVKLAHHDDGIAKTQTGALFGTPVYISPEQIRSAAEVDHRADIYSLGCVAFELVLGRVPFERTTTVELIAAHLECAPPSPRSLWPEIPAALDAVLSAMLVKDPAKRLTLGYLQEAIDRLRRSAFANPAGSIAGFVTAPNAVREVSAPTTSAPVHRAVPLSTFGLAHGTRARPVAQPASPGHRTSRRTVVIAGAILATIVVIAIASTRGSDDANNVTRTTVDGGIRVVPIELASAPADATLVSPISDAHVQPPAPIARSQVRTTKVAPSQVGNANHPTDSKETTPRPTTEAVSVPSRGELAITSKPPCDVTIDGKSAGHTPLPSLTLDPGMHNIALVNDEYGIKDTIVVQILAGKQNQIVKDYLVRKKRIDPNGTIDPFGSAHP
jgi:serine/threonine protein kinase